MSPLWLAMALAQAPVTQVLHIEEQGLTQAWRGATDPRLQFPFAARGDQQLTGATLWLRLEPEPSVRAVHLWLNGEKLQSLSSESFAQGGQERPVPLPVALLRSRNLLGLSVESDQQNACGQLPPGVWKVVQSARLELSSAPVVLPDNLGLLPLPFVDRDVDQRAEVALAFGGTMQAEVIALAGAVAGILAESAPVPLSFRVTEGALPASHAVVLVDGELSAQRLGLAPPTGPAAALMPHPAHPQSPWKLLVLEGRNREELRTAVHGLGAHFYQLAGARMRFGERSPRALPAPRMAPRWTEGGRPVRFAEIPSVGRLSAGRGEAVSVRFRLPPDLWAWPAPSFPVELGYALSFPPELSSPRLWVEFNGVMVGALFPEAAAAGRAEGRQTLQLPSASLRGYNVLRVWVEPSPSEGLCAGGERGNVRLSVSPDSLLHLEGFRHFAVLPDVARFVQDGYPFTQVADLSETAVLLSDAPTGEEVGALLSVLAHLASVTGVVGTGVSVHGAGAPVPPSLDKELLVVGVPERHRLLRQWAEHWPVQLGASRAALTPRRWADFLWLSSTGRWLEDDWRQAKGVLGASPSLAAVMGIRSPLSPRRSAVAITASSPRALPAMGQLVGHTHSARPNGDVLLYSEGSRWMFQLGPSYHQGQLDRWTQLRWFLSVHWLLLLPLTVLGVALGAVSARRGLRRRAAQRLGQTEAPR